MKIIFVSNVLNHHQKPISEALYKVTNGEYRFVATAELTEERKALGFERMHPNYLLEYSADNAHYINDLIENADLVIIGAAPLCLIKERLKLGKLTFRYSERLFKTKSRYLKWPIHFWRAFQTRSCYILCSSAFASKDFMSTGFYKGKCFKWGYFPQVKVHDNLEKLMANKGAQGQNQISIVWAARLLPLKHPEYVIQVAKRLKKQSISFVMHLIGNGQLEEELHKNIIADGLEKEVIMHGAMSPDMVRMYMEQADIFLFTSDRQEGWGAVVNEAMNSACAVVASHAAGSVPFLIAHGENGLIFKSGDVDDLYNKVLFLINNPDRRKDIGLKAYKTMIQTWNAENCVNNLIELVDAIEHSKDCSNICGPCSKAPYLKENWITSI